MWCPAILGSGASTIDYRPPQSNTFSSGIWPIRARSMVRCGIDIRLGDRRSATTTKRREDPKRTSSRAQLAGSFLADRASENPDSRKLLSTVLHPYAPGRLKDGPWPRSVAGGLRLFAKLFVVGNL